MITLFETQSECCGCSACSAVCPKNAINMAADEKGFYILKLTAIYV